MDYTLLSCSLVLWKLERYIIYQHRYNYHILFCQIKCVRYWPEKLHDSVTLDEKFLVTYSSNTPFAEYEIRIFELNNVSKIEPYQQAILIS